MAFAPVMQAFGRIDCNDPAARDNQDQRTLTRDRISGIDAAT
jgi:hypothetical protein